MSTIPAGGLICDSQAYALVLVRTGDERVRMEESERLAEFALHVSLELLTTYRERLEEARDGDRRTSLRAGCEHMKPVLR